MDLELNGKKAIVTGGSVGIGKATARQLAKEGVDVLICARRQDVLEQAASELASETGRKIVPVVADTTSSESVDAMVTKAVAELGGVDILVNNAAAPGGFVTGPLDESDDSDLLFDINTKVVGYFRCARAVAPHMRAQGWGRIINIGGLAARNAGTFSGLRNAALAHLTKTLSLQLGPDGINVNLSPPWRHAHRAHLRGSRQRAAVQRHPQARGRHRDRVRRYLPRVAQVHRNRGRGGRSGWRSGRFRLPVVNMALDKPRLRREL